METCGSEEVLLSPARDPLTTLTLARVRLARAAPVVELKSEGDELLLYGLIGAVSVEARTEEGQRVSGDLRPLRWRVDARGAVVLRFPPHQGWTVTVRALDRSADYLLVRRAPAALVTGEAMPAPVIQEAMSDEAHRVGEGAYQREVRVFETPEGFHLQCGETLNPPGHWSSWPSHYRADSPAPTNLDHQEVFFVITPSWGLLARDGFFAGGMAPGGGGFIAELTRVRNGDALVMPLGTHPIVASPESWLWYFWCFYGTALEKTYNTWATDVATYRS